MKNSLFYVEEKEEEKVDLSVNVGVWPYGLSGINNWVGGGGGGNCTWATYGVGAYNGAISWGNWAIENRYSSENSRCF